jgi:hypothetical protein
MLRYDLRTRIGEGARSIEIRISQNLADAAPGVWNRVSNFQRIITLFDDFKTPSVPLDCDSYMEYRRLSIEFGGMPALRQRFARATPLMPYRSAILYAGSDQTKS